MIYGQYTTPEIRLVVIGFLSGLASERGFDYLLAASALEHGITQNALLLLERELEATTRKLAEEVPDRDRPEWEQQHLSLRIFLVALSEEGQKCAQEHPNWQYIVKHLELLADDGRKIKAPHEHYLNTALALRRGDPAAAIELFRLYLEQEVKDWRNQSIPVYERGMFYREALHDLGVQITSHEIVAMAGRT